MHSEPWKERQKVRKELARGGREGVQAWESPQMRKISTRTLRLAMKFRVVSRLRREWSGRQRMRIAQISVIAPYAISPVISDLGRSTMPALAGRRVDSHSAPRHRQPQRAAQDGCPEESSPH